MQTASYPDGTPAIYQFINKTVKYPKQALKNNIQGRVIIQFKISEEGKVIDVSVAQSVEKSLDEEALRVIRLMPDWKPALFGGLPFTSYFKLPIEFKLQKG